MHLEEKENIFKDRLYEKTTHKLFEKENNSFSGSRLFTCYVTVFEYIHSYVMNVPVAKTKT
jgi:hypothetical protein